MTRSEQIGFSQRIQLDWLEYTANLVLAGNRREDIVEALGERLRKKLSVGNNPERGNRDKAITILTKVWVKVPEDLRALRDEGLELLQRVDPRDHMLVHWGMCMATYPFFGTVAHATGRLLRLQGTAAAAQVQRRVRERLGERETVARATRRILRAFVDWGALQETEEKGIYRGGAKRVAGDNVLSTWVAKASLHARNNKRQSASALLRGPHLFPFEIGLPSIRELEACECLEITLHGLDHEVLLTLAEPVRTRRFSQWPDRGRARQSSSR